MNRFTRVWVCAAMLVVTAKCSWAQREDVDVSPPAEPGAQLAPDVRFSEDGLVIAYIESLMDELSPRAQLDRHIWWHVHVIDDPRVVNAFSTPGGHIYIYTGLLLAASSESEVAGALAHEMGHVVARHELKVHTTAEEDVADQLAVRYCASAGYDPRGVGLLFRRLEVKEHSIPGAHAWLSLHPVSDGRIETVNKTIARERLAGMRVGIESLTAIKNHIELSRVSAL
jgi:predicted Zn-dependent protease